MSKDREDRSAVEGASRMTFVDVDAIVAKIGDYELEQHTDRNKDEVMKSKAEADALLANPDVQKALYGKEKKPKANPNEAREKFVRYLLEEVLNNGKDLITPGTDPTLTAIQMETLLGKKGLELYKDAVEEERKDPRFRAAVFTKSLKHYPGPKLDERVVLWVAGPSASGKSYGASEAIKKTVATLNPDAATQDPKLQRGNNFVSVDGGIEREVSQMRQLVLQVALAKGYPGIKDLHTHTHLGVKGKVKKAAFAADGVSVVIPNTFTNPLTKFKIKGVAHMPGVKQVFSQIVAPKGQVETFRESVAHMGVSRAYKRQFGQPHKTAISMNNRDIGVESKVYQRKYFDDGRKGSETAKQAYLDSSKDTLYLEITNDLIRIYYDIHHKEWRKCDNDREYAGQNVKLMSHRDFDNWKKVEKELPEEKREIAFDPVKIYFDKTKNEWSKCEKGKEYDKKSVIELTEFQLHQWKLAEAKIPANERESKCAPWLKDYKAKHPQAGSLIEVKQSIPKKDTRQKLADAREQAQKCLADLKDYTDKSSKKEKRVSRKLTMANLTSPDQPDAPTTRQEYDAVEALLLNMKKNPASDQKHIELVEKYLLSIFEVLKLEDKVAKQSAASTPDTTSTPDAAKPESDEAGNPHEDKKLTTEMVDEVIGEIVDAKATSEIMDELLEELENAPTAPDLPPEHKKVVSSIGELLQKMETSRNELLKLLADIPRENTELLAATRASIEKITILEVQLNDIRSKVSDPSMPEAKVAQFAQSVERGRNTYSHNIDFYYTVSRPKLSEPKPQPNVEVEPSTSSKLR